MDFANWLLEQDNILIDFADSLVNVRETVRMSGNADSTLYGELETAWDETSAELERRGLLEDFKIERGMD